VQVLGEREESSYDERHQEGIMFIRPITGGISISQSGFGAATGGTLGCFVQCNNTNDIMLLSNMHVLQFYQKPSSIFSNNAKSAGELCIVQPCVMRLKQKAEAVLGRDKAKLYAKYHKPDETTPLLEPGPSQKEVDDYYLQSINRLMDALIELHEVATFTRGFLETNFDAAVAKLKPGTSWSNSVPDRTAILAPPPNVLPPTRVWKYGDASGAKKWGRADMNQEKQMAPFKTFNNESSHFGPINAEFKQLPIEFTGGYVWKITGDNNPFQVQGDSGSALCDEKDRLVALMSTGGIGNTAYAIPIDNVFEKLGVHFPNVSSGIA
jgi:hypothetical protein